MATKKEDEIIKKQEPQPASTLGSNLALGGFGNPMSYTPPEPRSIFGDSSQQAAKDFSGLPQFPLQDLSFGSTPVFPDNYEQTMTDRSRPSAAMFSGIRDTTSGFGIYGGQPQLGSEQTPSMAPTTDAISSFGNPMGSQTIRISNQYGTGSTTLTPEQQTARYEERQRAEQMGTMPRTPEQQQALLAKMRETGSQMRQQEASRQQDLTRGYYAFRERLEQDRYRKAMSEAEKQQARGGSGRDAMARAEQARFGAEIQRQSGANVGTGRRTPWMSGEVAQMPSGEQFTRGWMGSYVPVVGTAPKRSTPSAPAQPMASSVFNMFSEPSPFPQFQPSGIFSQNPLIRNRSFARS